MGYTTGNWTTKITDKKSYAGDLVFSDSGQLVADCNISNLDETECKANAKLIAAAPDLLEALQKIIALKEVARTTEDLFPVLQAIDNAGKAAIKKATRNQ